MVMNNPSKIKEYSLEKLDSYRKTAEINWQKSEKARKNRLKKAWKLVHLARVLLKEKFGATKIIIFGSILNENCFTQWSDVDIAVEGIASIDTFQAIGMVRELSDEIELNLVDINACSMSLKQHILQEGKEI